MKNDLEKRLGLCLFFCRMGVSIVFLVWTYDKLVRPEHGVRIWTKFYLIPASLAETAVTLMAIIELVLIVAMALGLFKRLTRGIFLFLSILAVSVPEVVKGYVTAILHEPHPTILYFTGFCLLACAFAIYYLRDYDTRFSLASGDTDKNRQ